MQVHEFSIQAVNDQACYPMGGVGLEEEDVAYLQGLIVKMAALWPSVKPFAEEFMQSPAFIAENAGQEPQDIAHGELWCLLQNGGITDFTPITDASRRIRNPGAWERERNSPEELKHWALEDAAQEFVVLATKFTHLYNAIWSFA